MELDVIIFLMVSASCFAGFATSFKRIDNGTRGWCFTFVGVFGITLAGEICNSHGTIYLGGGLWLVLIVIPGIMSKQYQRAILQENFPAARKWAQMIAWLHPADGWRIMPQFMRALELAQQDDVTAAEQILDCHRHSQLLAGRIAMINLFRITQRWDEFLTWQEQQGEAFTGDIQFLSMRIRALGETGELLQMVELYEIKREELAKLNPPTHREICRLALFAFCGRRDQVVRLFNSHLGVMPAKSQMFWLATADLATGRKDEARREFEQILHDADPLLCRAIERRVARINVVPEPLTPEALSILDHAATEHGQEQRFAGSQSMFSPTARCTQILVLLNVLAFGAEVYGGGATDMQTLFRLGAVFTPAVMAGDWWRLIAANFLHFGVLHLSMNMFALWFLGPFLERALGFFRYLTVYLVTGIGAMAFVCLCAATTNAPEITVGASGSVMGLVGATGALMLRGWLRERAALARKRLNAVVAIIALQTLFDATTPQVSMVAHLTGAMIGVAIMLLMRDRIQTVKSAATG